MIVAVDENGAPFSDETIMSNLITMLVAGEDTTAFTLAWAIHELCDSPRWREELRREADEVLGRGRRRSRRGRREPPSRRQCGGERNHAAEARGARSTA